ncbi:glycosyltransferase family 22 protein [Aulographum hederae CBS 113979]|uniref:Mannosyltransferase n=1 Tax=Aulographum hederae CBS 113979 TaxID=1176131 RepID=A0A6G1GR82_9PEZI|nr:glycosyltransferase family 22 protein [Aulographum hederae CBS 113979]
MWRRTYLFLVLVRLYFALSPSYLHPDENFQGPEVIAGRVFSYPVHHTWEFTSAHPIRSVFPLWLIYGIPMYTLRSLWEGVGREDEVSPAIVYWTLRVLMFTLSFVLEDWALHELVSSPRHRRVAVLLVASSYVTWTYQTHTFSNSVETLAVLWSLVLISRIVGDKDHSGVSASTILGFVLVLGTFNRITFPAFLLIPGLRLLKHFRRQPLSALFILLSATLTSLIAVSFDTAFYSSTPLTLHQLYTTPTLTPLNSLLYNSSSANLSLHGLHPIYQHFLANAPLLLGPAILLLPFSHRKSLRLLSALSATALLSLVPHQEARFLLPAVPLALSSLRLPRKFQRAWLAAWVIFNTVLGVLMGVYHQGGVVPAQMWLEKHEAANLTHVYWWKTYSPPLWLLDGQNGVLETVDLMGMPGEEMVGRIGEKAPCFEGQMGKVKRKGDGGNGKVYLAAPWSATFLDDFVGGEKRGELQLEEVWRYNSHLNLDDLDWGEDGVWGTLKRAVGRGGLVVWSVRRDCTRR